MEENIWLFGENAYFLTWYTRLFMPCLLLRFFLVIYLFWVPVSRDLQLHDILENSQAFPCFQAFVRCICLLEYLSFCHHAPFLFCLLLTSVIFLGLTLDTICLCESSLNPHSTPCMLCNYYFTAVFCLSFKFTRINSLAVGIIFYLPVYHNT